MKGAKILLPLVLFALSLASLGQQSASQGQQSKPNLAGKWVFNPQKSSLKMPAPSSMTLQIEQQDPQVRFARTQVYGDQKFNWELETVTDGQKEVVQKSPQYTANVRAYWDGNSLVLDQKITADDGTKATDVVTYSLVDNGKFLQALEHQTVVGGKGEITNKWMYERQEQ